MPIKHHPTTPSPSKIMSEYLTTGVLVVGTAAYLVYHSVQKFPFELEYARRITNKILYRAQIAGNASNMHYNEYVEFGNTTNAYLDTYVAQPPYKKVFGYLGFISAIVESERKLQRLNDDIADQYINTLKNEKN